MKAKFCPSHKNYCKFKVMIFELMFQLWQRIWLCIKMKGWKNIIKAKGEFFFK